MSKNIVYRKCCRCNYENIESEFFYLRDEIWQCVKCSSKYTTISKIINPDELTHTKNKTFKH